MLLVGVSGTFPRSVQKWTPKIHIFTLFSKCDYNLLENSDNTQVDRFFCVTSCYVIFLLWNLFCIIMNVYSMWTTIGLFCYVANLFGGCLSQRSPDWNHFVNSRRKNICILLCIYWADFLIHSWFSFWESMCLIVWHVGTHWILSRSGSQIRHSLFLQFVLPTRTFYRMWAISKLLLVVYGMDGRSKWWHIVQEANTLLPNTSSSSVLLQKEITYMRRAFKKECSRVCRPEDF